MTLTEFLRRRIDEDEQTAIAAGHGYGHQPFSAPRNAGWTDLDLTENVRPTYDQRFVREFSPARIKAECEAKRRLVEQVSRVDWAGYAVRDFVLSQMAQVYADHPHYQQEWAA